MQQCSKFIGWGVVVKYFSWPVVEFVRYRIEIVLGEVFHADSFGHVLA